jgi:hypothetical protein
VDESEWIAAAVPHRMIEHLRGKASERKMRLVLCASAWRLWHRHPHPRGRELLEGAERYADGEIGVEEIRRIETIGHEWAFLESGFDQLALLRSLLCDPRWGGSEARWWKSIQTALLFTLNFSASLAAREFFWAPQGEAKRERAWDEEAAAQADLIREIIGNPFRPSPDPPQAVLRWNDRLVPRLARAIHDERRWGDLPLLADALLDAGCEDEALMGHCRRGGEHARGCFVLDTLLGKS